MKRLLLFIVFCCSGTILNAQSNCNIYALLADHQVSPPATSSLSPQLSCLLSSAERGQYQTAYQLLVADDSLLLHQHKSNYWNSGKVRSGKMEKLSNVKGIVAKGRKDGKPLLQQGSGHYRMKLQQ